MVVSSENTQDTAQVAAGFGMPEIACDVSILVCNAGITGEPGPFAGIDMADYAWVMTINLRLRVVLCIHDLLGMAARPGGGAVVLVSINAGLGMESDRI